MPGSSPGHDHWEASGVHMPGQAAVETKAAGSTEAGRIAAAPLISFALGALHAAGLSEHDAQIVASLMVEADLRGSDTHGVIRLPIYLRRLKAGGINPRPNIRITREKPASALVD